MIIFREILEADAELLLQWRTSSRVAKFMLSQVDHDVEKQRKWIRDMYFKEDQYHWIVESGGEPAAYISLSAVDTKSREAHWGFYLGDTKHLGLGALIPKYFYAFVFLRLKFTRLFAVVESNNVQVIRLHRIQGYVAAHRFDCEIWKDGAPVKFVGLELSAGQWLRNTPPVHQPCLPTAFWQKKPAGLECG